MDDRIASGHGLLERGAVKEIDAFIPDLGAVFAQLAGDVASDKAGGSADVHLHLALLATRPRSE
jgi:hypothetical protein